MKNKIITIVIAFITSCVLQEWLGFLIKKEFISTLLTVFSIFFGFYITSFAVFATSKYLARLYRIENKKDNRKTLLDDLLDEFSYGINFLLSSIIYLVLVYIIIENKYPLPISYIIYFIWGIVALNIYYIFKTIIIFSKITRKSAIAE